MIRGLFGLGWLNFLPVSYPSVPAGGRSRRLAAQENGLSTLDVDGCRDGVLNRLLGLSKP